MAYDKDELIAKCIEAVKEKEITQFDELPLFVSASLRTLYYHELHELQDIKEAMDENRIRAKKQMRKNWRDSEAAPALQIAAYKLMATDEEFEKLTMTKSNIKAEVTTLPPITIPDAPAE